MVLTSPVEKRRALTEKAARLLAEAGRVLVTVSKNPKGDALASALALTQALKAAGKTAFMLMPGELASRWHFLPNGHEIKATLAATRPLIIRVDTQNAAVSEVKYEEGADALFFILTPNTKALKASAVRVESPGASLDLIITVGVAGLELLAELQAEEPRLLYDTPLLNIDNSVENAHFGELNLVVLTVSSLAEIALDLLKAFAPQSLGGSVPTLLLAGIITATNNFQDVRTTPDSLQTAAELIRAGADQQLIIKHLYRTKPLNALKLWGKAVLNLSLDETLGCALATLTSADFAEAGAVDRDVAFVADELKNNLAKAAIIGLLWQTEPLAPVNGYLEWPQPEKLAALNDALKGVVKNHHLVFQMKDLALTDARARIFELLRRLR